MKIGIDIDETLTDTEQSFNDVLKKYKIKFDGEYKCWFYSKYADSLIKHLDEILGNAKLKFMAKEVLNKLYKEGHKLIIITARNNNYSNNVETLTKEMLKRENLKISEIYFGQNKKSDIAKKLNLDLMIDDNINVYNNMLEEQIDCILFGDKIKNWNDVLNYIKRKEKENGKNN